MSLKSRIEAILFLTDKPLKAQAVARIVNEDVQLVRQAVLELINDYEQRDGALEISDDEGYIIQVKDQYGSIIDEFVPMELPMALLRTLSAIAIKQPVMQSEVIKIRGAGAYDHIKELLERELIVKKEEGGRSPTLSTTKKFQEYFRLSHDGKSLRQDLKEQLKAEQLAQQLTAVSSETAAEQLTLKELAGAGAIPAELTDMTPGSAGISPASPDALHAPVDSTDTPPENVGILPVSDLGSAGFQPAANDASNASTDSRNLAPGSAGILPASSGVSTKPVDSTAVETSHQSPPARPSALVLNEVTT
jgi:segregation and condensation protein B